MSYTEVNMREGLPYGGMPFETSLWRMEETDPAFVRAARAARPLNPHAVRAPYGNGDGDGDGDVPSAFDDGGGYDSYVRAEIIDWAPDTGYLESDQPRRDPSLSRSQINVRYNGNRGNYDYLPQHPELFIGFTDNDPRGAQLDPLLNEVRGQMSARTEAITVRMGDNDDNHVAERPWMNQSISYGKKEMQRRVQRNAKIFSNTREGRPWGRNTVTDEVRFSRGNTARRAAAIGTGGEGLPGATGADAASTRFRSGDSSAAPEQSAGPRTADGGVGAGAQAAGPWRHSEGSTALGAAAVALARGIGPAVAAAAGGALAAATRADAAWANSASGRAANRQLTAASAAVAARFRRAARSGRPDQAAAESYLAAAAGASAPRRDTAAAAHKTAADGLTAAQRGAIGDGTAGGRGEQGVRPGENPGAAARHSEATTSRNVHLTNAAAIVTGLREGTASSRRKIADLVVLGGYRAGEQAELGPRASAPVQDTARAARHVSGGPGPIAAAARGLAVHVYGGGTPTERHEAALAAGGFDAAATWRASRETVLKHGKNPEWRGGQAATLAAGYGRDDSVGTAKGRSLSAKPLRAGAESHTSFLTEEAIGHDFS